mgnify:CR=1 FL=1
MSLYGANRDISLFRHLNRELLNNIIAFASKSEFNRRIIFFIWGKKFIIMNYINNIYDLNT